MPAKQYYPIFVFFVLVGALAVGMGNLLSGLVAESDAFIDATRAERNAAIIEEGSFRIAYFIEAIVIASLLIWKYDAFDDNNRKEIVLLNMALVFCAILLMFVRSENGGRVAWHYLMGIIASVTHLSTCPKHKNSMLTGAIIVMLLVLYLRILTLWGNNGYLILYPYKSFFTNGVREGDRCHDVYEYDFYYDQDKFYK